MALVNNLRDVTNPSFVRLARRAGIKRLSGDVPNKMRDVLKNRLHEIMEASNVARLQGESKTLMLRHVLFGYESLGYRVLPSLERNDKTVPRVHYDTYISQVLKQVHPDTNITGKAMLQLEYFCNYLTDIIAFEAFKLKNLSEKKTISEKEVKNAAKIILNGELVKHANSEGCKAVQKYRDSLEVTRKDKKSISKAQRAGLIFPPPRAKKALKKYSERVGGLAPIYCSAVVEYMISEILELAGNLARDTKRVRIKSRHLFLACHMDPELDRFFAKHKIIILGGGVIPEIKAKLLPSKDKKKKKPKKKSPSAETTSKPVVKKPHRFRAGTVALREIRNQQKKDDVVIQKLPFERYLREVYQDYDDSGKGKVSSYVIPVIQMMTEDHLIKVLNKTNDLVVEYKDQQTIMEKDIEQYLKLAN